MYQSQQFQPDKKAKYNVESLLASRPMNRGNSHSEQTVFHEHESSFQPRFTPLTQPPIKTSIGLGIENSEYAYGSNENRFVSNGRYQSNTRHRIQHPETLVNHDNLHVRSFLVEGFLARSFPIDSDLQDIFSQFGEVLSFDEQDTAENVNALGTNYAVRVLIHEFAVKVHRQTIIPGHFNQEIRLTMLSNDRKPYCVLCSSICHNPPECDDVPVCEYCGEASHNSRFCPHFGRNNVSRRFNKNGFKRHGKMTVDDILAITDPNYLH
jgi:hypothetical protein